MRFLSECAITLWVKAKRRDHSIAALPLQINLTHQKFEDESTLGAFHAVAEENQGKNQGDRTETSGETFRIQPSGRNLGYTRLFPTSETAPRVLSDHHLGGFHSDGYPLSEVTAQFCQMSSPLSQ